MTRDQVRWARDNELLLYRVLSEERSQLQVDALQKKHFGEWSDVFSTMEKCSGKVMLCLLGRTVIGYQAFTPYATSGNPFPDSIKAMRLTAVQVREDETVQARGLGIAGELLIRVLHLAWNRGFDAVYSYVTAYELIESVGLIPMAGKTSAEEAKHYRNLDRDNPTPILYYMMRPEGFWDR